MTKNFTLLLSGLFMLMSAGLFAQSPRMCFVEEATQASCPPCASANPALQATLNDNADESIFVAYQVWWPGYDAMYEDNTAEVDERIGTYYSEITGAPNIIVQGNSGAQSTTYLTNSLIGGIYDEMSEFTIDVSAEVVNGELLISGDIECFDDVSGDLRLRLIITEKLIHTEDLIQQGTNGETEFHHVFKKFVNGPEGIDLMDDWTSGDTYTIDETFDLGTLNIYSYAELEVVAIIQNDDNKFVHQAAKDGEVDITVDFDNTAGATSINEIEAFCQGTVTIEPTVKIQNTGNDNLTSATIMYNVNGGTDESYEWTGDLSTLATENVTLPAITFDTQTDNVLNVTLTNPNGMADEFMDDNEISQDLELAPETNGFLIVNIETDNYGDEVYWEIQNSAGETIAQGGNPNVGLTNYGTGTFPPASHPDMYGNNISTWIGVDVPAIDCYTFYLTDYYGDGLLGGAVITVEDDQGNEIFNSAGYTDIVSKSYEGASIGTGVEEETNEFAFNILSNPIKDDLNISFNLPNSANTNLTILDSQGRIVRTENMGQLASGNHVRVISMNDVSSGIYFVNLVSGNQILSEKVVVNK